MGRIKKRAQFFTIDALIALTIIILTIIIIAPVLKQPTAKSSLPADILQSIGNLKIGEMEGIDLVELGITDLEKPVIEAIGELYITNISKARQLSEIILASISPTENIGIWYGSELLASKNITPFETAENVLTERQIISGIGGGDDTNVTGFSAKASLSSGARVEYFYFGGYVGEGNITTLISYSGDLNSVEIEFVIDDADQNPTAPPPNFEIWVNGIKTQDFIGSTAELTPVSYPLDITEFVSGIVNRLEIKSAEDYLHISGGFIKIVYDSDILYEQPKRYYFPGIDGIINLYDGLYIPGDLTNLEISLLFNNSLDTFLKIGNTILFNGTSDGTSPIIINDAALSDAFLSDGLTYDNLSRKTLPLRLGISEAEYIINETRDIHVVSSTDISGSMNTCSGISGSCAACPTYFFNEYCLPDDCEACGGTPADKLVAAMNANRLFIDKIFNTTLPVDNLIGLNAYHSNPFSINEDDPDPGQDNATTSFPLSGNIPLLNAFIDTYEDAWIIPDSTLVGRTCICCGVLDATVELLANSDPSKYRSIVVMSDGEANQRCEGVGSNDASTDAIDAACTAFEEHGIKVHTIAFGSGADEDTLRDMAFCGNGIFVSGGIDDLDTVYNQIAEEILRSQYFAQTVVITGTNYSSKLYPESYIEFEYAEDPIPIGLITTIEKEFLNSSFVNFSVPPNFTAIEANVISYSGSFWTSIININNNNIYNLSNYGTDFIELGDPNSFNIPPALIQGIGDNNLSLGRGIRAGNVTGGSSSNKVIYKVLKLSEFYSSVSASANGCSWTIQFDSYTQTFSIPSSYSGPNSCIYNATYPSGLCESISIEPCAQSTDAIQIATYNLLKSLDFDNNGIVDVDFSESNLKITTSSLGGIPFLFSTEVRINKWY